MRPLLLSTLLSRRSTVSIEMDSRAYKWRILRGRRLVHESFGGKVREFESLEAAGLPVPKWTEVVPETKLDPNDWGPYVVTKPSRGGRGAYVWIQRTGRVRFRNPEDLPADHPGRLGPMIAQAFVYTGKWPIGYRVLTYFAKPILAVRYDGRRDLPPLDGKHGFKQTGGISIVASARGAVVSRDVENDVIQLACRAHEAFPTIPSFGVDIVRDAETGKLFVCELNPIGDSWLLTNDQGLEMQRSFDIDAYGQFDALETIADQSINVARQFAE